MVFCHKVCQGNRQGILFILSLYYLYIIFILSLYCKNYLYIIFRLSLYYLYTTLYYLYTEILSKAFSANSATLPLTPLRPKRAIAPAMGLFFFSTIFFRWLVYTHLHILYVFQGVHPHPHLVPFCGMVATPSFLSLSDDRYLILVFRCSMLDLIVCRKSVLTNIRSPPCSALAASCSLLAQSVQITPSFSLVNKTTDSVCC